MAKTNAKQEFLNHIGHTSMQTEVLCAIIECQSVLILTTGYTKEDWNDFLNKLDFHYDNGYGGQELFGTIWYTDGTWSERGEYDGSEWWTYHICPKIPENVRRIDKEREEKLNKIIDEK
jgi:hypothetical protein